MKLSLSQNISHTQWVSYGFLSIHPCSVAFKNIVDHLNKSGATSKSNVNQSFLLFGNDNSCIDKLYKPQEFIRQILISCNGYL